MMTNKKTRATMSLPMLLLITALSVLCLWGVFHFAQQTDNIPSVSIDPPEETETISDKTTASESPRKGPSSSKVPPRISAKDAAKLYESTQPTITEDAQTTVAEMFRRVREELAKPNIKITESEHFRALTQTLKNEHDSETRAEIEAMIRKNIKEYIAREHSNGNQPIAELIDMMTEETDACLRDLYAQALAENLTPDEITELLKQWDDAAKTNNEALLENIGAIMAKCTDEKQTESIAQFIADNPTALDYIGTGPSQEGSSLGVKLVLDAFALIEAGTPKAAEFAAQLEKAHGAQAIVSLDAVLNMPRDEEQRTQTANLLAAIGTPDAVYSLGETLRMAQTDEEIATLSIALGSLSNPMAISALLAIKASDNTTPQLIEACDKALANYSAEQIQQQSIAHK